MYCIIHLAIVLDVIRRFFFISSHCDVDIISFSESGEGWSHIFVTFSITLTLHTGKSAIIFSEWNLNEHPRDCLCKRIALE